MNREEKYIVIGRFGRPNGLEGWMKIRSETNPKEAISDYSPWYIQTSDKKWQKIETAEVQPHGKIMLVHLEGINTPEAADLYKGKWIFVQRNQLAQTKKEEYYWADLEGLTVINQEGSTIGVIDHLMETGANDVLVVVDEKKKRHLIPFLQKEVILNIDLKQGQVTVNWNTEF